MACDFFTVETVFLSRYYAFFFIEHASRRVHLAGCTTNPDGGWVTQQARNVSLFFAEQQIRFLIRDRDSKYSGPFDEVFRSERIRIVQVWPCASDASVPSVARGAPASPQANAQPQVRSPHEALAHLP